MMLVISFTVLLLMLLIVFLVHKGEAKRASNPVWQPTLVRVIPRHLHDHKEA